MARPSVATVLAYTSSGVPFQWNADGYRAKGARDANLESLQALVAWNDASAFLRDIVGYTGWTPGSIILHRVKPLECPFRAGLYCDDYDFVDMGTEATRTDWADPFGENVFEQDWLLYQLTFRRPKYRIFSDDTLVSSYSAEEQNRYCGFERRYVPRERRVSGFLFRYLKAGGNPLVDADWQIVPDEAAFIPDYQIEYVLTWTQVPVAAVPDKRIRQRTLCVNDQVFVIRSLGQTYEYEAGEILFKGPQQGIEAYQGADGAWYEDLRYVFAFQPGGWNSFLRPDLIGGPPADTRDYGPVQRRKPGGGVGGDPPYPKADLTTLFRPGPP